MPHSWYLIHSKPQQETTAAEQLDRQGFHTFLPRMRRQVRHAGHWRQKVEAMFPRYLFVQLDADTQDWAPIRSTVGVSTLVRFGNRPACVPEALVEDLRERADAESIVATDTRADFNPGQRVRIIDGPFAGLEGIIQARTARDRVDLLLAVIGQAATTRITTHNLTPC